MFQYPDDNLFSKPRQGAVPARNSSGITRRLYIYKVFSVDSVMSSQCLSCALVPRAIEQLLVRGKGTKRITLAPV